jgi:hypothetical protein
VLVPQREQTHWRELSGQLSVARRGTHWAVSSVVAMVGSLARPLDFWMVEVTALRLVSKLAGWQAAMLGAQLDEWLGRTSVAKKVGSLVVRLGHPWVEWWADM